jgi:flavin-dependent dehydrogenase
MKSTPTPPPPEPVVVVGASAAGLFAAHQLAQAHVPVRVYERSDQLTSLARTLIVTPEIERVLGFSAEPAALNRVHTLELCAAGRAVPIALKEPDLIVERAELLRMLARRAVRAGAEIVYGHDFRGFHTDGEQTVVAFRERATGETHGVAARAVVAADGVRSHVARRLGVPSTPSVTVLQARVSTVGTTDPGIGKVWFVPQDTTYFYWLCPESAGTASVGLVDVSPQAARAKLDRFLAEHGWEPQGYQAALVPLYRPGWTHTRRIGRMDVLFVGDAASQVKVTTIGGTVSGLLGAQAAARAIVRGTSYAAELRALDRELRLHWAIRGLMNRFREHEYDVLLQLLGGRVGQLLEIHNRDRLARVFWSILAVQPRLPLLAARVLWRAPNLP